MNGTETGGRGGSVVRMCKDIVAHVGRYSLEGGRVGHLGSMAMTSGWDKVADS